MTISHDQMLKARNVFDFVDMILLESIQDIITPEWTFQEIESEINRMISRMYDESDRTSYLGDLK